MLNSESGASGARFIAFDSQERGGSVDVFLDIGLRKLIGTCPLPLLGPSAVRPNPIRTMTRERTIP
jgi:hypothetical protein